MEAAINLLFQQVRKVMCGKLLPPKKRNLRGSLLQTAPPGHLYLLDLEKIAIVNNTSPTNGTAFQQQRNAP